MPRWLTHNDTSHLVSKSEFYKQWFNCKAVQVYWFKVVHLNVSVSYGCVSMTLFTILKQCNLPNNHKLLPTTIVPFVEIFIGFLHQHNINQYQHLITSFIEMWRKPCDIRISLLIMNLSYCTNSSNREFIADFTAVRNVECFTFFSACIIDLFNTDIEIFFHSLTI